MAAENLLQSVYEGKLGGTRDDKTDLGKYNETT